MEVFELLVTKTPDNINSLSLNDVIKLIPADIDSDLPKPINRMKVIRVIFQILGYDLSPDLALALCAEPLAQLIIATAGGGKTTGAQINAILQKIWRKSKRTGKKVTGDKILCLVYNKHNVKPMENKHKMLVNRLRTSNISDLNIDDEINAATMHSFCDQIRKEHVAKMQLVGFHLQKDIEANKLIHMVKNKILAKYNIRQNPSDDDLLSLYNYAKESMQEVADLTETDKFQDIRLSVEIVEQIFTYYERLKKAKRRYDYVDLLTSVYTLLKDDAEALRSTQRYFEYIIADEIQDFTPIMMSILQLLVSNGTPLMCIGDEDQGIYNFRGADIYNTLDFDKKFEGGEVYSLTRNRRCRKAILDTAKEIISENNIRYHKVITGVKDGGNIEYIPYSSIEGEHIKLMSMLKELPEEDLNDSVICYRDRASSLMLTEMLAEEEIPFYVISGYEAFSHPLYKDLIAIFNALESPFDKVLSISLYKVLPIKKDKMYSIFGYEANTHRFKDDTKQHFAAYNYDSVMGINGFAEAMDTLKKMSQLIQTETMDKIFPTIFRMLCKYHWKLLRTDREALAVYDDFMETRVDRMFNQHKSYAAVSEILGTKMERCRRNSNSKTGLAISTFHGLKGLEFKNCYLLDLDNNKFPNFSLIDNKPYSPNIKAGLKECETRLYYVAITRAKDNLFLFYNEDNPSRYVLPYIKSKYNVPQFTKEETVSTETEVFVDEGSINIEPVDNVSTDDDLLDLLDDNTGYLVESQESAVQDTDDFLDLLDDDCTVINTETNEVGLQKLDIDALALNAETQSNSNKSYLNNLISSLRG